MIMLGVILGLCALLTAGFAACLTLSALEDGLAREAAEYVPDLRDGVLRWVNPHTAETLSPDEFAQRYPGITFHPMKPLRNQRGESQ